MSRFVDASYEEVAAVALTLCARGHVLGSGGRSVGPVLRRFETLAEGRWSWCVQGLQGQTLVLAHDAFEAAYWFCRLEAGIVEPNGVVLLATDAHMAALETWANWAYTYRFTRWGDGLYEPPIPLEK